VLSKISGRAITPVIHGLKVAQVDIHAYSSISTGSEQISADIHGRRVSDRRVAVNASEENVTVTDVLASIDGTTVTAVTVAASRTCYAWTGGTGVNSTRSTRRCTTVNACVAAWTLADVIKAAIHVDTISAVETWEAVARIASNDNLVTLKSPEPR
jgi:hypothetical protein